MVFDYIIIGSGVSGSLSANYLTKKNKKICVLESESDIGGRFGTLKLDGKTYNYGNLFIRDSHEELATLLNHFLEKNLKEIRMDYVNLIDQQYHIDSRYIYLPESLLMVDVCTELLHHIDVRLNSTVISIESIDKLLKISCSDGETYMAQNVILTAPTYVAKDLLSPLGFDIEVPNFNTIFTLLADYDSSIKDFDFPYYKFINHPVLKELFVDKKNETLIIHANDYMREPLDSLNMNLIRSTIFNNYKSFFDIEINVKHFHVWKFAKNLERKEYESQFDINGNKIYLISDWVAKSPNMNGVAESFRKFISNIKE